MRSLSMTALGFAVALSGCSDAGPGTGTGDGGLDESEALRLGRVHLVLSTVPTEEIEAGLEEGFELTARFAMVRGLDEEFVRARADMPDLLEDLLNPGQCAAETALWSPDLDAELDPGVDSAQELVLVDAGDLEVQLGDTRLDVPLSLVPDLLPYMSGVEYAYYAEEAPLLDEADAVTVAAAGGLTDDLPAFTVESPLPGSIELSYTAEDLASVDAGALVVRWTPDDTADEGTLGLRLTPTLGGEPVGDDILCLVNDRGQARLEFAQLHTLGFAHEADGVRVEANRTRASLFDVGAWAGTELVVERRDVATLPLR